MEPLNSQKMLEYYLHDYFAKRGMHETAEAFAIEVEFLNPTNVAIKSPGGMLADWWDVFYDVFTSNQAEHAQVSNAEVMRTMGNVVPQVPYVVTASFPHFARPAHNILPVVPAFSPERLQEQPQPRISEDEVTSTFRFLEMDHHSQRAPFLTDSSRPMELIPHMPQQWVARDEGEGRGIYFEQTMLMESNADAPKKAMLPVRDPSEAGSSVGSCPGIQQTP